MSGSRRCGDISGASQGWMLAEALKCSSESTRGFRDSHSGRGKSTYEQRGKRGKKGQKWEVKGGERSSRQPRPERKSQKIERTNRESMEGSRLPGGARSHLGTTDPHPSITTVDRAFKYLGLCAAQTFSPNAPFSFLNASFSS